MTATTYRKNAERNGIEIIFTSKPNESTRTTLKESGFRWHKIKKLWYAKETPERLSLAEALASGQEVRTTTTNKGTEAAEKYKANKELLRAEYLKEWNDPRMVDYCTNKASHIVTLSDGGILPIEKKSIETRFCFGESGFDYDEAAGMAHHAATNFDYFREQNLKAFNEQVKAIEQQTTDHYHETNYISYVLTIGKHKESNICYLHYERLSEVIEAVGGSAYLPELPGRTFEKYGQVYRIPTAEELADLLAAYKEARTKHAKRVETYLKKYGLSKVHTWTYWRDR